MSYNYFKKKKWTEEQEKWLLDHKDIRGKALMHKLFCEAFLDADFTPEAISSKRTEIGAFGQVRDRYSNSKPLYSERVKKGYVLIKVSKCEWWPKNKWIWVSTHPGEPFGIHNQFVFLDCDNRNFNPDNIMKVDHRIIGIVNRTYGGLKKDDAENNKLLILKIQLKLALLDRAEKLGLVSDHGAGRILKSEVNERSKYYRSQWNEERIAEEKAKRKIYYANKTKDLAWKEKQREYHRRWYEKKKEKKQ